MLKRILYIIVCCLLPVINTLWAQYKFDKPVFQTTENRLPVNTNQSMCKGKDGFIWLGSNEGLRRFDGLEVKTFTEGKDLRHSLFDNSVAAVIAMDNKIWMGTKQGVSVLNTKDYTFRHYQFTNKGKTDSLKRRQDQAVSVIYQDRAGKIWIGTANRGVAVYDETKDDFHFFPLPQNKYPPLIPALGSNTAIITLTQSIKNDSIIWAGTAAGLQQINKFSGTVELFSFPSAVKEYQVALNAFRRLYHHDDGLLYVGSWAAGINVFNPGTKTFTPLEVKSEAGKQMVKSVIANITRKSENEMWVSTSLGLGVYDTRVKDFTWMKLSSPDENRYYSLSFIDEAGRVWGGDLHGLNYFDPAIQQFSTYSFKQLNKQGENLAFYIYPDKTGNKITVCPRFTDGIYTFDKLKKEWSKTLFPHYEKFIRELEAVKGFVQIEQGEYYIALDKGIFYYSQSSNVLKQINAGFPFTPARRGDLLADHNGNLWLSDDTWGLTKWNIASGKFINYQKQTLPADSTISLNRLLNLFEDSKGNIWFQRSGGIGVYVASRDSIISFLYDKNEKNSLPTAADFAEDKNGRVWVASVDGMIGYAMASAPERGIAEKINIRSRGIADNIYMLATDPNGEVWGHNYKELVKINSSSLSFTNYSFQYGAKEADFFHFSFLPSGEMVFGGRTDITIANPSELKRNTEIPIPYISEIHILNQPVNFLETNSSLNLDYKQNFFSISFSARAYTMANEVKFRYRLKNFDEWTDAADRRFANYTNVPGGDYVFQLQAANNEGVWNKNILELPIHIDTPFWETWWFRLAVILLLISIVFPLYNYRENQIRKKEQLKLAYEKKIANVEMSSLLAQMNPHFIFNSLNSIDSYIIKNDSAKASEYLNNFARLMRLILQNSRSNYISLKDELEALDLYLQMEGMRFKNKFDYEIKVADNINTTDVTIPPMLIQPYVENAIWHGLMHLPDRQADKNDGTKGKVEIIINASENKLHCTVQDNGIGRGKAEEIKSKKSGSHKRSMGMEITQSRIEIINKLYGTETKVAVTDLYDANGEPAGTKVEMEIPY